MRLLLSCLLLAACPLGFGAPKPEVRSPDLVLPYRKTEQAELKLEIFRPAGWAASDQRPAVVFFFGGGWVGGSTRQFHPQANHLAKRGMVVICADYRVKSRHKTTPFDAVKDAKAAVRWLWRHAGEQGVDPEKIITSGGSAGGHLAACCGVVPGLDEVRDGEPVFIPAAMVLFNPVIDTSRKGYGYDRLRERFREISPLEHVHAGTAPTLLMVGSADTTTPPAGDKAFAARMKERKLKCRLEIYEGQKHGFFNARGNNENYWKTLKAVEEFLEELGYL
ncbi:MAG: alpha/beta hydrolase [Akkermansiaceae bacterium]|nr:alpha/beta hydrolase [Akkermansiaceae bacterium]